MSENPDKLRLDLSNVAHLMRQMGHTNDVASDATLFAWATLLDQVKITMFDLAARVAELEADKTALAGGWAACVITGTKLQDRVAELEKGPKILFNRKNTHFDLFESLDDAIDFGMEHGGSWYCVLSWTHHPASKPEPEASA